MTIYRQRLHGKIRVAIALAGVLSLSPSVQAQNSASDTIIITAPRIVARTPLGATIEQITVARFVSYDGLNLRTDGDVAELNKRVASAAHEMCQELDSKYPIGEPDTQLCAKDSIANSQAQIDAAIARAKRG